MKKYFSKICGDWNKKFSEEVTYARVMMTTLVRWDDHEAWWRSDKSERGRSERNWQSNSRGEVMRVENKRSAILDRSEVVDEQE